jgi:hypothetical protein
MARIYTSSPLGLILEGDFSYGNGGNSRFSTKNTLNKTSVNSKSGLVQHPLTLQSPDTVHVDDVYEISTFNIIRQLENYPTMKLKWADFAYCRDYGVYPNNRLVVCRRFDHPMIDDLTFSGREGASEPISTIITWMPESTEILSFNFGESWVEAQPSFKELLNDVGDDMGLGKINFKLGDALSAGMNLVSLPGFTQGLQRSILGELGVIDKDSVDIIPSGTPNLIKESMQRKLIKDDSAGSGLVGKFSVVVKCAWEQKFISGVDPTLIYYDILQTILAFGGSQAVFYLGKRSNLGGLGAALEDFLKPGGATRLIRKVVEAFSNALKELTKDINDLIGKFFDSTYGEKDSGGGGSEKTPEQIEADEKKKRDDTIANAQNKITGDTYSEEVRQPDGTITTVQKPGLLKGFADTIIKKYRIQALGVVTTLTGLPSTPWHITIGNPLRPIFSSGDMLTQDVKVNLGAQLSFNDLPSYIECEFTLVSARNLGIDEIIEKLSCSGIRISNEHPTFWNTHPDPGENQPQPSGPTPSTPGPTASAPTDNKQEDELQNVAATQSTSEQSKVGNENSTGTASTTGQQVNPDPNSNEPVIGAPTSTTPTETEYVVKPGDSIWKIAKNKLGPNASKSEIDAEMKNIIAKNKNKNPAEADGIVKSGQNSDPDFLQVGDKLII